MKSIKLFIFILSIQTGFTQSINSFKLFQSHKNYKSIEDSICTKINFQNSIIYKTCDDYRSFYLIEENSHWTCYFIKNIIIDGFYLPRTDTLANGETLKYEPIQTELYIFNADSLIKLLFKNHIKEIQQFSEDSIQKKSGKKDKKKNILTIESLPQASHDCDVTIIIYSSKFKSATYRGVLISAKYLHIIPTLKIFYITKEILINTVKDYYH